MSTPPTKLDRVHPTVVVRRRVYEVSSLVPLVPADDDDESGPPSSVNVARALATLRADELVRLEHILSACDEDEAARAAAVKPVPPPVPAEDRTTKTTKTTKQTVKNKAPAKRSSAKPTGAKKPARR